MFKVVNETEVEIFDTKEAAIERMKAIAAWKNIKNTGVYIKRAWCPWWFAELVQATKWDWLAYYKEST